MIRTGIIGISGFGAVHYDDLIREVQDGRMAAVAATVINQDEEAEKCTALREMGCRLFEDYREMLDAFRGNLDLCIIPTGIQYHAPMSIAAMRAGANVLVEKPAAATLQEVRAMQQAEQETGKFTAVGYQHMYTPGVAAAKKAILGGAIGKLLDVKCRGLWPRADGYYTRNRWAGKLRVAEQWVLDSPFNNALAHYLNLMCFLAGREFEVSMHPRRVRAELYRARPIESCDTACIRATDDDDVNLLFYVTHCSREQIGPTIHVRGSSGSIVWHMTGAPRLIPDDGEERDLAAEDPRGLRVPLLDAVVARMTDPSVFVCTLDIAGAQTLCANAAHRSAEIRNIPPDLIERITVDGDKRSVIADIEATTERAFEAGKLFSELGVPWAHEGRDVDTADAESWVWDGALTGS